MLSENLEKMLDSFSETGVYVIEQKTHNLLYFNQYVKEVSPEIKLGMKCHEMWPENCKNCPLLTIEGKQSEHSICYNDPFGKIVDVIANKVEWEEIPAYVIIVTPHKLNSEEQQELKLIEKLYTESLVTVFKECIIVNLTKDTFVNCQKDMLWEDLPDRGHFNEVNLIYAEKMIHPDDFSCFRESFDREALIKEFENGRKQVTRRLRRLSADGTYHMMEFHATKVEQPGDRSCWGVMVYRDIQEEYLSEQRKNIEIGQLAMAAKAAYQMLISANLTKNTYHMMEYDRFLTQKAERKGTFDELIEVGASTVDPDFREAFISTFSREALLQAFEKGENQVTLETRQMGDDGVYHWNSTQVVRIESPYTDDIMEITMTKNIDEERKSQEERLEKEKKTKLILEEALERAERASLAKSDFLSKISHDIRTPMNAIIGMTELAQVYIKDMDKLEDYLSKIEASGKHLLSLINEVLDVSKIESGKAPLQEIEFNVCELVKEAALLVQPAAIRKEQEVKVHIKEQIHALVAGDESKLRQVLVNILENSTKYTDYKGTVNITLTELKQAEKKVGTYRFVIEDTGIGMKKEYIDHIFEPFSRADDSRISKIAGTGLGMTITYNLLRIMGGNIKVESEYGKGSRFIITLCLNKKEGGSVQTQGEKTDVMAGIAGMRVLLAEDNEMNQEIAVEMLKLMEIESEIADNGKEALEAVKSHPADYYDMIFMDIQMPVMNGYEATVEIRKLRDKEIGHLPIIAMTADAFSEDVKKARIAGMNGHLAKPFSMADLKKSLEECVRLRKAGKNL